jgi:hypothetical protein
MNAHVSRQARQKHLQAGFIRVPTVIEARKLRRAGKGWREIYEQLGVTSQILKLVQRVAHIVNDDDIKAADLADQVFKNGRKREIELTADETAAVRANRLLNNRDENSGSTTEAIRQTFREGKLRPEVYDVMLGRHREGRPMVTDAIRRDLHISPAVTRSFRNPREAWLTHIESPGSLHYWLDENGELTGINPGEAATIDDGTKNFVCTVPLQRPGDKCWEHFKCIVGRWQILLMVDHRTYFITAVVHTARPKSQYRGEDITATFHLSGREHGMPKMLFLEKGISKANLIHSTLDLLGVKYQHVNSPHRKVVEFIFNTLWSKLSFLPGQVGRTRGEESEVDSIFRSCQNGATDPRDYFLPLATVLKALHEVIAEWNAHTVNSPQYGRWVPADWFKAEAKQHMRPVDVTEEWMFAPAIADGPEGNGLLVRGSSVQTSFLVMPGLSLQFDFQAPWLNEFYGSRIRFHYNPFVTNFQAYAILGTDYGNLKAGERLGYVDQTNLHTRVSRKLLGFGDEPDIGLEMARRSAQALYRSGFAIRPDGKPGVERHEARDGLGNATILQAGGTPAAEPQHDRSTPATKVAVDRLVRRRSMQNEADDALANLID